MADSISWHGQKVKRHEKLRDDALSRGYRFLSISLHGTSFNACLSAVMILRPDFVVQRDWPCLEKKKLLSLVAKNKQEGFEPVLLSAMGAARSPRFAVVFEKTNDTVEFDLELRSGKANEVGTLQARSVEARTSGLIPRTLAIYGDKEDPRYAVIWQRNHHNVVWNTDGVLETSEELLARQDAQTSGWCRPAFVTLNSQGRYASLFVSNEIGSWVSRPDLSSDGLDRELEKWQARGYFPLTIQGGGGGDGARYAAIFVKQEDPLPMRFTATGPSGNTDIDAVVEPIMRDAPIGHASLAIVHEARLVYARAYSWGGPFWPICQPTTHFRIASVAKLVTALAIYQLIEEGILALSDRVQDILQLWVPGLPGGGGPTDSRFGEVTIQNLLEHTSGIAKGGHLAEVEIVEAHRKARPNHPWRLPATGPMGDSYIASLQLEDDPGTRKTYNNAAHYLLGRVVAKLRGKEHPIQAYEDHLLAPLSIQGIRRSPSLLASMPDDEARYRAWSIPLGFSVMSDDRPKVPIGYGDAHLERLEGSGGLSATAPDLGRLIALLMTSQDTAAMKRSTVVQMFNNALANQATWGGGRAGHGWDVVNSRANGLFYGQKGGSLSTSGNVLQIDSEWGFAICWGGKSKEAYYPDFPAVMNLAKAQLAGAQDLFPQFGFPPL